jgi:hypothetical protein
MYLKICASSWSLAKVILYILFTSIKSLVLEKGTIEKHLFPYCVLHPEYVWRGDEAYSQVLTLSNPIFLPTAYSPALICFVRGTGWWITCNYPRVLKEKNMEK